MATVEKSFFSRAWAMFFLALVVGVPTGVAAFFLSSRTVIDVAKLTLANDVRGSLYGALVSAAGFLLAIMLALLAVISTLDEKPIMVRWTGAKHSFTRLIDAVLGPVFTTLAMGLIAVACIAIPERQAETAWAEVLVAFAVGLTIAAFVQAGYLGALFGSMLLTSTAKKSEGTVDPHALVENYEEVKPEAKPAKKSKSHGARKHGRHVTASSDA